MNERQMQRSIQRLSRKSTESDRGIEQASGLT